MSNLRLNKLLQNYFENGDFDGVEIPNIKDVDLKWLFNQILMVIDELKSKGISSVEFLNTSNWGIKQNGNLGIFDLGYGNFYENFDDPPEHLNLNEESKSLPKILSKMGVKNHGNLGSGNFGHAYDIGNGRVLKITKDKTEAINSSRLMNKKNTNIADIYDVKQFVENGETRYVIILEKLKLSDSLKDKYIKLFHYFDDAQDEHLNPVIINKIKNKHPQVSYFMKDMIKNGYEKTFDKWNPYFIKHGLFDKYDFNDISDICDWIQGSVTNKNDMFTMPPKYIKNYLQELL